MKVLKKQIERIFKKKLGEQITSVKPMSKGHINTIFDVKTKKSEYVLRIVNEPWKAKKELFVYK